MHFSVGVPVNTQAYAVIISDSVTVTERNSLFLRKVFGML